MTRGLPARFAFQKTGDKTFISYNKKTSFFAQTGKAADIMYPSSHTPENPLPSQQSFDAEREKIHRKILSAVSHDLKTPLATVIGTLEIYHRMKNKLTPDKIEALLDSALHEAKRLDGFITNILDLAKLESAEIKVKKETVNLDALIHGCIAKLNSKISRDAFNVLQDVHPITLATDPMLFTRAMSLILDNVLKHCGKNPQATIQCNEIGAFVRVVISDNGTGIPDGKTEEIFQKFTRFAAGDSKSAGTGLGLPLCRLLMNALGGSVEAQNGTHGGAQFILQIPSNSN